MVIAIAALVGLSVSLATYATTEIKKVGGITFIRCCRVGGSIYIKK